MTFVDWFIVVTGALFVTSFFALGILSFLHIIP